MIYAFFSRVFRQIIEAFQSIPVMRQFVSGTDSNSGLPKKTGRTNRRETGDGLLLVRRQGVAG